MPAPWERMLVTDDISVAERHPDGRLTTGVKVKMTDAAVERTRLGYKCINCFEELDNAFPKECPLCGFPMEAKQAETFGRVFAGHMPEWREGADLEAEADRMEAEAERRAFQERTGISVVIGKNLKKEFRA